MLEKHIFATVKDVMSEPIIYIETNKTVQESIDMLRSKDVYKGVIHDSQEQKIIGYTDIWKLRLLDAKMKIGDALKTAKLYYSQVSSVNQDKSVKEVMPELLSKGILLVENNENKKIGVITPQDIEKLKLKGLRL